eukprot:TRINITY_DN2512_c2_g2_i1.p1 TRINITY_DN2512_c2_g2~~TRINITY_DN2512_c2_g2_i1.p1  ORF type:complete len:564 (-),score=166.23 TRINITY_DN2512_c2_g2_i1:324-1931(-)
MGTRSGKFWKGEKEKKMEVFRTLVLGNSQAGKSTFFKQLRLLHSPPPLSRSRGAGGGGVGSGGGGSKSAKSSPLPRKKPKSSKETTSLPSSPTQSLSPSPSPSPNTSPSPSPAPSPALTSRTVTPTPYTSPFEDFPSPAPADEFDELAPHELTDSVLHTLRSNLILAFKELFAEFNSPDDDEVPLTTRTSQKSSPRGPVDSVAKDPVLSKACSSLSLGTPTPRDALQLAKFRELLQGELKDIVHYFEEKNPFESFDEDTVSYAKILWRNSLLREIYHMSKFRRMATTVHLEYIMDNVDRISMDSSVPTRHDYLLARSRTTGISTFSFVEDNAQFEFLDVGGQRSERRHWTQVMKCPQLIVFFASLIEYDIPTFANPQKSKLHESLGIWEEMLQVKEFDDSSIVLILNQSDLLEQKIVNSPYTGFDSTFPEEKATNAKSVIKAIRKEYIKRCGTRIIQNVHIVCALKTDQVRDVFQSVRQNFGRGGGDGRRGSTGGDVGGVGVGGGRGGGDSDGDDDGEGSGEKEVEVAHIPTVAV